MWTRHKQNTKYGRFVVPFLTVAFVGYFGFHAINGEHGLNAKANYELQRAELVTELEHLKRQRLGLEGQVRLLHDGTLERDMLDERARSQLNYSRSDEVVIYQQ